MHVDVHVYIFTYLCTYLHVYVHSVHSAFHSTVHAIKFVVAQFLEAHSLNCVFIHLPYKNMLKCNTLEIIIRICIYVFCLFIFLSAR